MQCIIDDDDDDDNNYNYYFYDFYEIVTFDPHNMRMRRAAN